MRTSVAALALGFLLIIGVFVGGMTWQSHKDLAAYQRFGNGYISAGTKFGVTVGTPWTDADAAIRQQFSPAYVLWQTGTPEQLGRGGGYFPAAPVMSGEAEVSYRDQQRGNGVVTLFIRDGNVTAIQWYYSPSNLDS